MLKVGCIVIVQSHILILSRVSFPKEFGCYWLAFWESLKSRVIYYYYSKKYLGIICFRKNTWSTGINQGGGELGGENSTQITRIAIVKQQMVCSESKESEKEHGRKEH